MPKLMIDLSQHVLDALEEAAAEDGVSVSEWVEDDLIEALGLDLGEDGETPDDDREAHLHAENPPTATNPRKGRRKNPKNPPATVNPGTPALPLKRVSYRR